ncbi:MAG: PIN domain-containing protein [Planctomycetota bacterium]|nr:PIN domain-containing protein [Planctomycetota bacterium]
MLIYFIRASFLLIVGGIAARVARTIGDQFNPWAFFVIVMGIAMAVLVWDIFTARKKIQTVSAIFFGLIAGLVLSDLIRSAVEPTLQVWVREDFAKSINSLLIVFVCFSCVTTLIQTKDDFRFVIPYVEFSREIKGPRPLILDTSVIIDGRIADVAETKVLDQAFVVPRFVLQELQAIADSSDKLRRNRGRRGLDILNRLQKMEDVEVILHDADIAEVNKHKQVDHRLVALAKHLGGKVVTNDYNLNKIAKLQGIDVINLNDIANSLKPVVLPGEHMMVKIIKRGEEHGQGVGYLDDGTMIVVEQGAQYLSDQARVQVTSVLQTSAGRMIFGKIDAERRS